MTQKKENKIDRRNFLKALGATSLGSVIVSTQAPAKLQESKYAQVPKRKLGRTGVEVPCLSLGTNRIADNQIILRNALQHAITYWDTAPSYMGGNTELCIGKFLSKNPQLREQLFIVSKASGVRKTPTAEATVAQVEQRLQTSLERMNTKYIDLYYGVHGLSDPDQLTDELRQWAKDAKKRNLIRLFGFSTHRNIAQNLTAAAKVGWIDVIMTAYNFRLMQDPEIQAAIDKCHEAGLALIAMKTVALSVRERTRLEAGREIETEEDKKLLKHFLHKGLTVRQAKIKAVLQDERISSACVGMNNVGLLASNAKAALEKPKLTEHDFQVLIKYARATRSDYCAGCAYICDSALPDAPYVSDIMRYLMYYNSYGQHDRARELFAQIPANVRSTLLSTDYSTAEQRCPQHMPIAKLVAEAVGKLA